MICLRETPRGDQRTTEIPTRDVRARGCARFMRDLGLTGGCSVRVVGLRIGLRHHCLVSRASCLVSSSCEGASCDDRGDHACVWVCGAPAVASRDASRLKAKPAPMCAHYVVWAEVCVVEIVVRR